MQRFPPGDRNTHYLLASIWALVASWATGKPHHAYEIAPYLELPEDKEKRVAEDARKKRAQRLQILAEAHKAKVTDNA